MIKYRASKTLAERATWGFMEANAGSIGFDVATILPCMVYGVRFALFFFDMKAYGVHHSRYYTKCHLLHH